MSSSPSNISITGIEHRIHLIRGQRVILDADLAGIYGVETRALLQSVRRNLKRYPPDFVFQLTENEFQLLRSQIVISKGRGGRRYRPYAFTEYGAIMAANTLKNFKAIQTSVFVVRAFLKMREALSGTRELARKLAELEQKLTGRLDIHERAIVDVLQKIMDLLNPPPPQPDPPQKQIGFHVREKSVKYLASPGRNARCHISKR